MNKINWKLRLKNPYFYITLIVAVATQIGINLGITMNDLNTWMMVWDVIVTTVSNPAMFISVLVTLGAFFIDPTTVSWKDSAKALTYDKPKGDKQ